MPKTAHNAALVLVFWLLAEFVDRRGHYNLFALFFWITIVCAIVGVVEVVEKNIGCPRWGWIACCVVCIGIIPWIYYGSRPLPEPKPVTQASPIWINMPQSDYIEGTTVTHKQLRSFFPFGYAVVYPYGNERYSYVAFTNNLMNWDIDLTKVKIDPDFAGRTVTADIPTPVTVTGKTNFKVEDMTILSVAPLRAGVYKPIFPIYWPNYPSPNLPILSADQRNPVFALGYRIGGAEMTNGIPQRLAP